MANLESRGAAGAPKNAPRNRAGKAGRAAAPGSRSFKARARQPADRARAAVADKTAEASAAVDADAEIMPTHLATGQEPPRSGREARVLTFGGPSQKRTEALRVATPNSDLAYQAPNIQAAFQVSSLVAKGVQDVWRAWFDLTQRSLRTNLEAMGQLANCRSAQEVITLQSNLLRSNLQQAIGTGEIIARASSNAFGEAARAMRAQPQAAATAGRAS